MKEYFKQYLQIFDSLFYYFFCKKSVLFYVKNEIGYLQLQPIIEKLKNRKDIKLFFTLDASCELDYKSILEDFSVLTLAPLKTLRFRRFSCIVVTDLYPHWHIRKCPVFMMTHGSAIGNADSEVDNWTLFCWQQLNANVCLVNSRAEFEHLDQLPEKITQNNDKIFLLGGSIKQNAVQKNIKEFFGYHRSFDSKRKTIIVFSHFTPFSLLRNLGDQLIDVILSKNPDAHIIITGHPKLWTENTTFKDDPNTLIFDYLKEMSTIQPRVHFYSGAASGSLMALGDLFICDYSSVRVELAARNKPTLLFIDEDFEFQSKKTGEMYKAASHVFSDLRGLSFLLDQSNSKSLPKTAITNTELFEYFSYDKDGALNRHLDAINELLSIPYIGHSRWNNLRKKAHQDLADTFGTMPTQSRNNAE